MKKLLSSFLAAAIIVTAGASFALSAHAQTAGIGNTPVLYSQNGVAYNPNGTALAAGNYYDLAGDQVYYYGNGIYYDAATDSYGGHLMDANGNLVYYAPGAPNTGEGGALVAWAILALSGLILVSGFGYLGHRAVAA